MRLILPCAGTQIRWRGYLGIQKQWVPVNGEPLVHRTVRQFLARAPGCQPYVVVRQECQHMAVPGAELYVLPADADYDDSTKLLSSLPIWDVEDRTIIVFGDVCCTDAAVETILGINSNEIEWFGHAGANAVTGKHCGEIFGLTFPASRCPELMHAAMAVKRLLDEGRLRKCKAWETYCQLHGLPFQYRRSPAPTPACFTEIVDETEDFDRPRDYERWLKRRTPT